MSIFNMFRNVMPTTPASPPAAPPAQPTAQNNPSAVPQGAESTQALTSPLDPFKDVWSPAAAQAQSADPFAAPYLQLDEGKLAQGLQQVDFTRGMNPELLQKAMSGDAQAFMETLNHVSRATLQQSTRLQTATTESALRTHSERVKGFIPDAVRQSNLQSQPISNPALAHPSVEPMLRVLRGQIAQQNPNMTPQEVASRAENFFTSAAQAVNMHSPETAQRTAAAAKEDAKYDFTDYTG
jgi:hypothetical protein